MLPVPEVDLRAEFYWTSGADGVLRFQHCSDCGSLVHPPSAACHRCRGVELDVQAVSGRGTIVAATVNYQAWRPDLAVPYAIAVLAIDEDPRVRPTAPGVGADPAAGRTGPAAALALEERGDGSDAAAG